MGAIVWITARFLIPAQDATTTGLFLGLTCSIIIGIIAYGAFSYFIKSPELASVVSIILKDIERK
jgi:hypothetical protein